MAPEVAAGGAAPAGLLGAGLLGLSMGLSACAASCVPTLGTWAFAAAHRRGDGLRAIAAFNAGRLLAYGALGLLAGAVGAALPELLTGRAAGVVTGLATLVAAAWLVVPARAPGCPGGGCAGPAGPMLLGLSLGLRPCAPLASLLAASALAGSPAYGAAQGLSFGLGAAVAPSILLVVLAAALGRRMVEERAWLAGWLRWGGAVVLGLMGLRRLLGV